MKWVLMKAVYIREHGLVADLKVSEVPTPSTGPGEVLVKVEA
jgi:NADPH:quinone reductase-like Zn-dependent oxidoreductase